MASVRIPGSRSWRAAKVDRRDRYVGVFPHYWVFKAYWMAVEGRSAWILALLVGAVTLSLALWLLMRRFEVVARR